MPHSFLWLFLTGWAVRPVDVCEGLPGVSEERRIHLQHPHKQESARSEARASSRWPDGGENKSPKLSEVTVSLLRFAAQMSDDLFKWGFKVPLLELVKCEDPHQILCESRIVITLETGTLKCRKSSVLLNNGYLFPLFPHFRMWKRFTQEIFVLFLGSTAPAETLLHLRPVPTSPWWTDSQESCSVSDVSFIILSKMRQ